jgi:hypothetical protein
MANVTRVSAEDSIEPSMTPSKRMLLLTTMRPSILVAAPINVSKDSTESDEFIFLVLLKSPKMFPRYRHIE